MTGRSALRGASSRASECSGQRHAPADGSVYVHRCDAQLYKRLENQQARRSTETIETALQDALVIPTGEEAAVHGGEAVAGRDMH